MKAIVVRTTFPDVETADRVVRQLVEERLVACGQRGATIRSVYPWEGRIENESEVPVELKTLSAQLPVLSARLTQLHPYEVCEFLWAEFEASESYLTWMRSWLEAEPA